MQGTYLTTNLGYLRSQHQLSQEEMARRLNITRSSLAKYEAGKAEPPLRLLIKASVFFNCSVDELLFQPLNNEVSTRSATIPNILVVQVDQANQEVIPIVETEAHAGYTAGFFDVEFIRELPSMSLPNTPAGTYMIFQIKGDSMPPLTDGDYVCGRYCEHINLIKNYATYILVTREGIVYKRVINKLRNRGHLVVLSDNPHYESYKIKGEDILQVWEFHASIRQHDEKLNDAVEEILPKLHQIHRDLLGFQDKTDD